MCSRRICLVNNILVNITNDYFIPFKTLNDLRRTIVDKLNELRIGTSNYQEKIYHREVPDFKKEKLYCVLVQKKDANLNYPLRNL